MSLYELARAAQGELDRWTPDPGVERVREFHEAFACAVQDKPWTPDLTGEQCLEVSEFSQDLAYLAEQLKERAGEVRVGQPDFALVLVRLQLLVEEVGELADALSRGHLIDALDALSDIGYVHAGTYLTLGLAGAKTAADLEVHSSNMSKLGEDGQPLLHASGRVLKGPNYRPPDLARVIADWEAQR